MTDVYVILNESTPIGAETVITDIVQPAYANYQDALQALYDIADEFNIKLEDEDSSVYVPVEGTHLEADEYYIISLEVQ